jgi:hypothetical protein
MAFTDDDYNLRLKELYKIKISLDPNPIATGFSQLNKKIAEIEAHKDFLNGLFLEATVNKGQTKSDLETKEMEFKMQMNQALVNDQEVRSQKTAELRESLAETKCAILMFDKHTAQMNAIKADNYFSAVQQLYNHVQSVLESLFIQIKVVQLESELGAVRNDDLSSAKNNQ